MSNHENGGSVYIIVFSLTSERLHFSNLMLKCTMEKGISWQLAAQRELVIDSKIFCFNWLQTDSGWKGVNLHMSSEQECRTTHDS